MDCHLRVTHHLWKEDGLAHADQFVNETMGADLIGHRIERHNAVGFDDARMGKERRNDAFRLLIQILFAAKNPLRTNILAQFTFQIAYFLDVFPVACGAEGNAALRLNTSRAVSTHLSSRLRYFVHSFSSSML